MFDAPPEARAAAGYLLALGVGIVFYMRFAFPRAPHDVSVRTSVARLAVCIAWGATIVSYLLWPAFARDWNFFMYPQVRWATTVPAAVGLLCMIWAVRSTLGVDAKGNFVTSGPYNRCRYPFDAALTLFMISVTLMCSNWLLVAITLIFTAAHRLAVPFEIERVRRARLGVVYDDYAARTGWFLPSADSRRKAQYQVPSRFSLTAIMGLLTVLAIIFGLLKSVGAHPAVYLFIGSEILAICVAQILVGTAPRGGSTITGALLLPIWVYATMSQAPAAQPLVSYFLSRMSSISPMMGFLLSLSADVLILLLLVSFGALLGYCIGTLAAGFFLMMDLIEPWLLRDTTAYSLPSVDLPVQDGLNELDPPTLPQRKALQSWRERQS